MNNYFNNCLSGIDISEKGFCCLKKELISGFDLDLANDLLNLPCIRNTPESLNLIISVLKDGHDEDMFINALCNQMENITINIWEKYRQSFMDYLYEQRYIKRPHLLSLISALEKLYARHVPNVLEHIVMLYERLPFNNYDFSPHSEENVRIKCAKIAYNTTPYNMSQQLEEINCLKTQLKKSGNTQLLGIVFYYKALCLRDIIRYDKDTTYFMLKSKNKGYALADIYLDHLNVETSRKG